MDIYKLMEKYIFKMSLTGIAIGMLPLIVIMRIITNKTATWVDAVLWYSFFPLCGIWFAILIAIYVHEIRKNIKLQKGG